MPPHLVLNDHLVSSANGLQRLLVELKAGALVSPVYLVLEDLVDVEELLVLLYHEELNFRSFSFRKSLTFLICKLPIHRPLCVAILSAPRIVLHAKLLKFLVWTICRHIIERGSALLNKINNVARATRLVRIKLILHRRGTLILLI